MGRLQLMEKKRDEEEKKEGNKEERRKRGKGKKRKRKGKKRKLKLHFISTHQVGRIAERDGAGKGIEKKDIGFKR